MVMPLIFLVLGSPSFNLCRELRGNIALGVVDPFLWEVIDVLRSRGRFKSIGYKFSSLRASVKPMDT